MTTLSSELSYGPNWMQAAVKRAMDITLAFIALSFVGWVIVLAYIIATIDTRQNGLFTQKRVGRGGKLFPVLKIRTMRNVPGMNTSVTTAQDRRITRLGWLFRKLKIDEMPQLINVLLGHMSAVGPRPEVPGYADYLHGDDQAILAVRPGLTGPATLKYINEEQLLMQQDDPDRFNDEVLFPDKVKLNKNYVIHYSLTEDIKYILKTIHLMITQKLLGKA